jgi:hypothetical protein
MGLLVAARIAVVRTLATRYRCYEVQLGQPHWATAVDVWGSLEPLGLSTEGRDKKKKKRETY